MSENGNGTTSTGDSMLGASCCLEGLIEGSDYIWRTPLRSFPFVIGRRSDADLVLPSGRVSHRHAEIRRQHGKLWIEDLGSTNGTFVNRFPIAGAIRIADGDVLHFADQEFRLVVVKRGIGAGSESDPESTDEMTPASLPTRLFSRAREFREMMAAEKLIAHFQPVVDLKTKKVLGYELLSRGMLGDTLAYPAELFRIADAVYLELDLSVAMRTRGAHEARFMRPDQVVFINVHPAELNDLGWFRASLERTRDVLPKTSIVLEIHGGAVTDAKAFAKVKQKLLEDLNMRIALDDFGTGQARLLELLDVQPDFVKFDRAWIQGLHQASSRRRGLVNRLVKLLSFIKIATVAEGIECYEDARACISAGFTLGQGFCLGRPAPPEDFHPSNER